MRYILTTNPPLLPLFLRFSRGPRSMRSIVLQKTMGDPFFESLSLFNVNRKPRGLCPFFLVGKQLIHKQTNKQIWD